MQLVEIVSQLARAGDDVMLSNADAYNHDDNDDDDDIIAHNARCSLRAMQVWTNRVQCISDGASGGCVYMRLVAPMIPYRSQEVARQQQHSAPIVDCRLPITDHG